MAYQSTDERLERLEALVGQIIMAHQEAIRRIDHEAAEGARKHQETMRRLDHEAAEGAREHREAMLRLDRLEAEGARERENAAKERENAAKERENAAKERVAMNKRWGELAMKMGTFAEDIIAPNIPRIGRELFGLGKVELSALRFQKRHTTDPALREEFDYVYVTPEGWMLNETKASPRVSHVDDFRARLARLPGFFPEYKDRPLYPCFSSLYLGPDVVNYCTKQGIYALALGDDTVEVLNYNQLRPQ